MVDAATRDDRCGGQRIPRRIVYVDHRGDVARRVMRDVYGAPDHDAATFKNSLQYMYALFEIAPTVGARWVVHFDENVRLVPYPRPSGFAYESASAHKRLAQRDAFENITWVARSVALLRRHDRLAVVLLDRCSGFAEVKAHSFRGTPLADIGTGREVFLRPSVVPGIRGGVQNATAHFTTEAFVADTLTLRRLLPFGSVLTVATDTESPTARFHRHQTATTSSSWTMHTERMLESVFARSELAHAFIDKEAVHACNG